MKKQFASIVILLLMIAFVTSAFAGGYLRHTVQWNETVYSIPVHYNTTTNDFLALNHMDVHVDLQPGTVVLIRKLKPGERQEDFDNQNNEAKTERTRFEWKLNEANRKAEEEWTAMAETKPKTYKPAHASENEVAEDIGPNGIVYKISNNGYHLVEKKQTLFHIAVIYKQSIEHLKQLNNLTTTDIAIGQKLRVSN